MVVKCQVGTTVESRSRTHGMSRAILCASSIPRWWVEPGELRRLLGACDRRTPTGRRDYAILLLLSRLGLRAGEVARLGLDDIDWRRGEITIVGKAGAVRVNGSSDPPP